MPFLEWKGGIRKLILKNSSLLLELLQNFNMLCIFIFLSENLAQTIKRKVVIFEAINCKTEKKQSMFPHPKTAAGTFFLFFNNKVFEYDFNLGFSNFS